MSIPQLMTLTVNGQEREVVAPARITLVDALRHHLNLTGTHVGCEHGVCGACTVLVDGLPARACLMFAAQAEGREITTVEGLSPEHGLSDLQESFSACHGLQCGFCTPGFITLAEAFLRDHPAPSRAEVREVVASNLCRCTGYQSIVEAVLDCAARRQDAKAAGEPG